MVKISEKKKPTNPILRKLIRNLREKSKENEAQIWEDLADKLSKSNRSRAEVNLSQINRNTSDGEVIVVPGKVLGSGIMDHSVTIAAFDFSNRAESRILNADGEILSIEDLLEKKPEGSNVRIMK